MSRCGLLLVLLLGLGGCERGARLDVELMVSGAIQGRHVLAQPTAVELIDARGDLFRLPVARPVPLDLVAVSAAPVRLALRGRLRPGHYVGLRLVFDDTVWLTEPGGARTPLTVDHSAGFAELALDLDTGDALSLSAMLDLNASLVRLGPFPDIHRFLPSLRLVAERDSNQSASRDMEGDIATLPRFVLR
jgi:hypothetical protein